MIRPSYRLPHQAENNQLFSFWCTALQSSCPSRPDLHSWDEQISAVSQPTSLSSWEPLHVNNNQMHGLLQHWGVLLLNLVKSVTLGTTATFEVTSSLVKFLIRSSCSLWSWSFSCRSWHRDSRSVAVVCVTEETCGTNQKMMISRICGHQNM